jgi:hypothetical protein
MSQIEIEHVTRLHRDMVTRWHRQHIDNYFDGFLAIVCEQFSYNFLLWHEEDIARSAEVGDERIAIVKRAIDRFNQQRNDAIERMDDWISQDIASRNIGTRKEARLNTETVGSVIDRLSILTLRIYHLEEQQERADASAEHRLNVARKLAVALAQHDDLSHAGQELVDDIFAGRKRHKTYRQMKMYNDPAMNPYLYQAQKAAAA